MALGMRKVYEGCIGWCWACEKCVRGASDVAGHAISESGVHQIKLSMRKNV